MMRPMFLPAIIGVNKGAAWLTFMRYGNGRSRQRRNSNLLQRHPLRRARITAIYTGRYLLTMSGTTRHN